MKEKIVDVAWGLFSRLGIRSITMDDVARELSISKKTLYLHFENKDDLVHAVTVMHIEFEKKQFEEISTTAENAIDELNRIAGCMREHILKINPSTLHDLQKYHHRAYDEFVKFKHDFILGNVINNLKRGIAEGYYRDDIDPEVLGIIRMEQVQMMFDDKLFPPEKFGFSHVQIQSFNHFVYGLLTKKGREFFKSFQLEEAR